MELEQIALQDAYFIEKKLYPNVDFYSGIVLRALGFPMSMFTVLFAVARTVGWIAQWKEMIEDPEQKIGRPRQLYVGAAQARLRRGRQAQLIRRPPQTSKRRTLCSARPFCPKRGGSCLPRRHGRSRHGPACLRFPPPTVSGSELGMGMA